MACTSPISIRNPQIDCTYKAADDNFFVSPDGVLVPSRIKVPCGKCLSCQEDKRNSWAARLELESLHSRATYFGTLTYDDEHLPKDGSLSIPDLQKFWKRLRHRVEVRYFSCGEYGDRFGRPHYHFIAFLDQDIPLEDFTLSVKDSWQLGFIQVDFAKYERFRYVAKYTCKAYFSTDFPKGLQPPFAVMSRRPGLAFAAIDHIQGFFHDYLVMSDGRHVSLPRYLLEKLPDKDLILSDRRLHREETEVRLRARYGEFYETMILNQNIIRDYNINQSFRRKYGKYRKETESDGSASQ